MKRTKLATRLLSVLCAMGLAFCMTGCSNIPKLAPSQAPAPELTPKVDAGHLVKEGTLTIGLDYSAAPFAGESGGRVIGIDADVGAALAQELGLKAAFVDVGTGGGPNAVANKKCDVFLSFDRNDSVNSIATYAGTYMSDAVSLFVVDGNAKDGKPSVTGDYTAAQGKQIAAQKGRAAAQLAGTLYGTTSLVEKDTLSDAFASLEDGSVQFVAASGVVGSYSANSYDDIVYFCPIEAVHEIGAGVANDNVELQQAVSSALSTLSQNGTINLIVSGWIGSPLSISSSSVTLPPTNTDDGGSDDSGGDEAGAESDEA
jgi:polar amino acid transport system substrate-binding protein